MFLWKGRWELDLEIQAFYRVNLTLKCGQPSSISFRSPGAHGLCLPPAQNFFRVKPTSYPYLPLQMSWCGGSPSFSRDHDLLISLQFTNYGSGTMRRFVLCFKGFQLTAQTSGFGIRSVVLQWSNCWVDCEEKQTGWPICFYYMNSTVGLWVRITREKYIISPLANSFLFVVWLIYIWQIQHWYLLLPSCFKIPLVDASNRVNPPWRGGGNTEVVASLTINLTWKTINTFDKGVSSFHRLLYIAMKQANW